MGGSALCEELALAESERTGVGRAWIHRVVALDDEDEPDHDFYNDDDEDDSEEDADFMEDDDEDLDDDALSDDDDEDL